MHTHTPSPARHVIPRSRKRFLRHATPPTAHSTTTATPPRGNGFSALGLPKPHARLHTPYVQVGCNPRRRLVRRAELVEFFH